jgi:uncharacterized membrane protein
MEAGKKHALNYYELIPLVVMLAGFIIRWLGADDNAILLHCGFMLLGIAGILRFIIDKYAQNERGKVQNIVLYAFVILLVIIHFVFDIQVFAFMIVALLLQYFIRQRKIKAVQ